MSSERKRVYFLLLIGVASLWFVFSRSESQLNRIKALGALRVGILPSPAHYIVDNGSIGGVEYDLVKPFANALDVRLELVQLTDLQELNQFLNQGRIHIGIPGSAVPPNNADYKSGPAYRRSDWYLVYNRTNKKPGGLNMIARERLLIQPNSRQAALLNKLQPEFQNLRWIEETDATITSLLHRISTEGYYYTVIESDSFDYFRHIYPRLAKAFRVHTTTAHWLFPATTDTTLYDRASRYIDTVVQQRAQNNYRYFVGDASLDVLSSLVFLKRIDTLLPQYRYYFESAALRASLDWQLLAVISYQESHWDPQARSFTGVRGLMMLTQTTAERMGIRDRLDPQTSIGGGTEYLALLMDSLPERIMQPNRLWLALAAYNIGLGHLEDARILTAKAGKSPDKWEDVKLFLPLLAEKQWYEQTKHGQARGGEPVRFVEQIQRYYDILRFYLIRDTYAELDKPDISFHPVLTITPPAL